MIVENALKWKGKKATFGEEILYATVKSVWSENQKCLFVEF